MLYRLLSLLAILLFSGCSLTNQNGMSPNDKRIVYQSIQNEIDEYKIQAEVFYNAGYYADALKAYEMVNFYEDRAAIPLEKLHAIELKAQSNANFHYKQAEKYLKKNKKKSLIQLNKVMRNNPEHQEGKLLFSILKQDPEIQVFLKEKEEKLKTALALDKEKIETLKKINGAMKHLGKYDETNLLVLEAKNIMKEKRTILLNEAISLYHQGAFDLAQKRFQAIEAIYDKDPVCQKYLVRIGSKNGLRTALLKANNALKTEDYLAVISLCEKAMKYEPNNPEALKLMKIAKEEYKKQIPKKIEEGKNFYNNQNFKSAKNIFQSILLWDAKNNVALAYIKKIDQQLKTIESLR